MDEAIFEPLVTVTVQHAYFDRQTDSQALLQVANGDDLARSGLRIHQSEGALMLWARQGIPADDLPSFVLQLGQTDPNFPLYTPLDAVGRDDWVSHGALQPTLNASGKPIGLYWEIAPQNGAYPQQITAELPTRQVLSRWRVIPPSDQDLGAWSLKQGGKTVGYAQAGEAPLQGRATWVFEAPQPEPLRQAGFQNPYTLCDPAGDEVLALPAPGIMSVTPLEHAAFCSAEMYVVL